MKVQLWSVPLSRRVITRQVWAAETQSLSPVELLVSFLVEGGTEADPEKPPARVTNPDAKVGL